MNNSPQRPCPTCGGDVRFITTCREVCHKVLFSDAALARRIKASDALKPWPPIQTAEQQQALLDQIKGESAEPESNKNPVTTAPPSGERVCPKCEHSNASHVNRVDYQITCMVKGCKCTEQTIKNSLTVVDNSAEPEKPEPISLCESCMCMTRTNAVGFCGKCGANKAGNAGDWKPSTFTNGAQPQPTSEPEIRDLFYEHTDYRDDHTSTHWAIEPEDMPKLEALIEARVAEARRELWQKINTVVAESTDADDFFNRLAKLNRQQIKGE